MRLLTLLLALLPLSAFTQFAFFGKIQSDAYECILHDQGEGNFTAMLTNMETLNSIFLIGEKVGSDVILHSDLNPKLQIHLVRYTHIDPFIKLKFIGDSDIKSNVLFRLERTQEFDLLGKPNFKRLKYYQYSNLKKHALQIAISRNDSTQQLYISGIDIIEKKSKKLIQSIPVNSVWLGLYTIETLDCNFDKKIDICTYESQLSVENYMEQWFTYNPKSKLFAKSALRGINFEFLPKTQSITSTEFLTDGGLKKITEFKLNKKSQNLIQTQQYCVQFDGDKEVKLEKCPE